MSNNRPQPKQNDTSSKDITTFLDPNWTWSSPSTWPLSLKFLPLVIALALPLLFPHNISSLFEDTSCPARFNYTFQIARTKAHAEHLSTRSWELGTAAEALLELLSPGKAVFAARPFPGGRIPRGFWRMEEALVFVHERVRVAEWAAVAGGGGFSVTDPAAVGVASVMVGQVWGGRMEAARKQGEFLLQRAPRFANGAVSHRVEVAELWADAVFMFPPFLAYLGVAERDLGMLGEAVRQCELYQDVLLITEGAREGLWRHIVGPSEMRDEGAWSTGNAWAAYGMLRVRATVAGWDRSAAVMQEEIRALDSYVMEILDAAIRTDDTASGLLRNYLGDSTWPGETSGTTLLAAAAYRMAMLMPAERERLLAWADRKRRAVVEHVDLDGVARPAVNPLKHGQREPLEGISPEGESFLLMMGAAWRDCVCGGVCSPDV